MNYNVTIKHNKAYRRDEVYHPHTAIVRFLDDDSKVIGKEEYAYIEADELYNKIKSCEKINIKHCYVNNFSLSHYRKLHRLSPEEYVPINLISAQNAFFDGFADFTKADFGSYYVDFINTTFSQGVDFTFTRFGTGDVDFLGAKFLEGDVYFSEAYFNGGEIDFTNAKFGKGNVDFSYTHFGKGDLFFTGVVCDSLTFVKNIFRSHVSFSYLSCNALLFRYCIIEKTLDLTGIKVNIISFAYTNNLGQIFVKWKDNRVLDMIYTQRYTNYNEKAYQFRLLKENFDKIGRYGDEDLAYVEFKRCQRRSNYYNEIGITKPNKLLEKAEALKRSIVCFFNWLVFDTIGRYGTNPKRVFYSMLITVATFIMIYLLPFVHLESPRHGKDFDSLLPISTLISSFFKIGEEQTILMHQRICLSIYHSITTFLTIGYGDVNPKNLIAVLLSGFEGFMGLFLMSYFTVAFVRKVLR